MAFDFIEGLDCDPLDLDRRLKQAEDNPPGPVPPPPGPTPGYDYATNKVLTTSLPSWELEFEDVPVNSFVLKDNAVFFRMEIAVKSHIKFFVRGWAPRSNLGGLGGSGFSCISMIYVGDPNNPEFSPTGETGSVTFQGYQQFVASCAPNLPVKVWVRHTVNHANPLRNLSSDIVDYAIKGTFSDSGVFTYETVMDFTEVFRDWSYVSQTGEGLLDINTYPPQKQLMCQDGVAGFVDIWNTMQRVYDCLPLETPMGEYEFDDTNTNLFPIINIPVSPAAIYPCFLGSPYNNAGGGSGVQVRNYYGYPQEPIYPQENPTDASLKYISPSCIDWIFSANSNLVATAGIIPIFRVEAGQSFTPEMIAEIVPIEWNAM